MLEKNLRVVTIDLEIPIHAKKDVVWNALINDVSLWWHRGAFMTKAKRFVLEPHLGGRMYEDAGNGTGAIWGYVHAIETGEYILLQGYVYPESGGPATSMAKISLVEEGGQTTLRISDSIFGHLKEGKEVQIREGWNALYADGFKKYVEANQSNEGRP